MSFSSRYVLPGLRAPVQRSSSDRDCRPPFNPRYQPFQAHRRTDVRKLTVLHRLLSIAEPFSSRFQTFGNTLEAIQGLVPAPVPAPQTHLNRFNDLPPSSPPPRDNFSPSPAPPTPCPAHRPLRPLPRPRPRPCTQHTDLTRLQSLPHPPPPTLSMPTSLPPASFSTIPTVQPPPPLQSVTDAQQSAVPPPTQKRKNPDDDEEPSTTKSRPTSNANMTNITTGLAKGWKRCIHLLGCSTSQPERGFQSSGSGTWREHMKSSVRHRGCTESCPGHAALSAPRKRQRAGQQATHSKCVQTVDTIPPSGSHDHNTQIFDPVPSIPSAQAQQPISSPLSLLSSLPSPVPATPSSPSTGTLNKSIPLPLLFPKPNDNSSPQKYTIAFVPEPTFVFSNLEDAYSSTAYYTTDIDWDSLSDNVGDGLSDSIKILGPGSSPGSTRVLINEYVSICSSLTLSLLTLQ